MPLPVACDPWALETLTSYVRIPSVSAQGRGIDESCEFLSRTFAGLGFRVERIATAGHPVLLAERVAPGARRSIVFYNHYDVQPPEPLELWSSPPFETVVRDGRIWGRGVADNKANLIVRLAAVRDLLARRPDLPVTLRFLVEGEEEIGSPNLGAFVATHLHRFRSDLCIWENGARTLDGRLELILGCKGVLHLELALHSLGADQHSSRGAILPSAPWRLVWVLAGLKDADERVRIQGFYDPVRATTPADREVLAQIPFDEAALRAQYGARGWLGGRTGIDLRHRLFCEPAVNINGLTSGYQGKGNKTVLPSSASAKLDVRLVPDQTPEGVRSLLRGHLDRSGFPDVEITHAQGYPPARTPVDHPIIRRVARAAEAATGKTPVPIPMMPASGPMYLFADHMPLVGVGTGNPDSRAHAPDENITVEDFRLGQEVIVHLLEEMAGD